MQFFELGQIAKRFGKGRKLIVRPTQLYQAYEVANTLRQSSQVIIALPHQKSDLTFFKKHTLCRSVLCFQPVHHYIDFPSLKTQQVPKLCYKGQIPGDVIRDSHVGKGISLRRVPREAHVESGLSLQTRRELLQQMISQYCQATTVKMKSKLLDAFTVTTGYNLKYAM